MKFTHVVACLALMAMAATASAQPTMNLIGDPEFNEPYNWVDNGMGGLISVPSADAWTAAPGSQGVVRLQDDSDADPTGLAGAAAQFTVDFRTYVMGDPDDEPDTLQFQTDWKRTGPQFFYSNGILIQVRGVNGDAPTANNAGTPLGTLGPTNMFASSFTEPYTWGITADPAGEWQTSELFEFNVEDDYDYYLIRIGAGIPSQGTEPEYDLSSYRLDDVFLGIVGFGEERFPGDADNSGTVDLADLAILATNWNTIGGATWEMGDFTGEGDVDLSDLAILATNWNQSAPALSAAAEALGLPAVPEPATLSLLGLGALALVRRRRR